jgi:hypothetical protein
MSPVTSALEIQGMTLVQLRKLGQREGRLEEPGPLSKYSSCYAKDIHAWYTGKSHQVIRASGRVPGGLVRSLSLRAFYSRRPGVSLSQQS